MNLIPRYLPRFGMAPEWAVCRRPLVLVVLACTVLVTTIFNANVEAQGGAYATGVLVLMSSAGVGAAVVLWKTRWRYPMIVVCAVFAYTTVTNIVERPEGIRIASVFILAVTTLSLISRTLRSTELRALHVEFDEAAMNLIASDEDQIIHVAAHRPDERTVQEYDRKAAAILHEHNLAMNTQLVFLEIDLQDASRFGAPLHIRGDKVGRHLILRTESPAIPNAIAAILLQLQRITGHVPHAYFGWTEGNPVGYLFRYLFLGEGDVAIFTREVLRRHVADPNQRPRVHVT